MTESVNGSRIYNGILLLVLYWQKREKGANQSACDTWRVGRLACRWRAHVGFDGSSACGDLRVLVSVGGRNTRGDSRLVLGLWYMNGKGGNGTMQRE